MTVAPPGADAGPAILFLNGTVGSGKTSTAFAVGELLCGRGVAHQLIDLDELRRAWPPAADDPFNSVLERANLRSLVANAAATGVWAFVLAGVIEDAAGRAEYERLLGPLWVVRLTAEPDALRERLTRRHEPGRDRDWHLARAGQLARIIALADVDDRVVDTTARTPAEVAIDATAGWIGDVIPVAASRRPGTFDRP